MISRYTCLEGTEKAIMSKICTPSKVTVSEFKIPLVINTGMEITRE